MNSVSMSVVLTDINKKRAPMKKMNVSELCGQGRELIFASDQVSQNSKKSMEMCSKYANNVKALDKLAQVMFLLKD